MDDSEHLTWLTDAADPPPAVGDAVEVAVAKGAEVLAFSAAGRRLGRLPPEEGQALAALLASRGGRAPGRVSAVVPRPTGAGGGRIHLRVNMG